MLKLRFSNSIPTVGVAAAFGRLCVETFNNDAGLVQDDAAAFGRLCVETLCAV